MGIVSDYKSITKRNNIISKYPKAIVPEITANDYRRSYIMRYFVQSASNRTAPIVEVDVRQFKIYARKAVMSPEAMLYKAVSLRWKVSGTREQIIQSNSLSTITAEETLSGIRLKLGNLLQFAKIG